MLRFPWTRKPDPAAVAREAAQAAVAEAVPTLASEVARALIASSPMLGAPGSEASRGPNDPRIWAYDRPFTYSTPQPPYRKPGAVVNTDTLRLLADRFDVVRACIQHLKRELAAVPIEIVSRDQDRKTAAAQGRIDAAKAWMDTAGGLGGIYTRRSHFESVLVEDLCIIGAYAVYFRPTRGGGIYEALPIDAATIRPVRDPYGWEPESPYEQWVYGARVAQYTHDELLYDGLYPKSYTPYFSSPLEWLLDACNAGLRSIEWNLTWLTDGTTPSDVMALPESWTPDQVRDWVTTYDSLYSGDSAKRQKVKWVPGGSQRVGNPSRKDQDFTEYDLSIVRRVCAIYGVQPASVGYAGEQYKVSQEDSMESTSAFGAGVLLEQRKALYDEILRRKGYADLEVQNISAREEDPQKQAARLTTLVGGGIYTPNEARQEAGKDAQEGGDTLFVPGTLVAAKFAAQDPHQECGSQGAGDPQSGDEAESGDGDEQPGAAESGAGGGKSDASDAGGFELLTGAERVARLLRQWERKALNRLRNGKSAACGFEGVELSEALYDEISQRLNRADTSQSVRKIFAEVIELTRFGDQFEEQEHPRGQGGKFASKPGAKEKKSVGKGGGKSESGFPAITTDGALKATATVEANPRTREQAKAYFGREVTDADFQQLLGAPAGAKIYVDPREDGGLIFHVEHPLYEQQHRAYALNHPTTGDPFIYLDLYHLKDEAPEGSGTHAFAQMVSKSRALGMDAIYIPEAARTSKMVGYYVWPRLGAEGEIPEHLRSSMPKELAGTETFCELMKSKQGRDWWKEKGETVTCVFHLDAESDSSRALAAYCREKGIQL